MGKKKKKSSRKNSNGDSTSDIASQKGGAADSADSFKEKIEIKKITAKPKEPPKGINAIPYWLRHEKGFSDLVAGGIVLLGAGLIIVVLSFLLILLWPAG